MVNTEHLYALADCNNFFVSCERVFRPDLRTRPVVVLSGNDGCVVARSNEVKKLGIKMGVPFFQIQEEVKKYGIVHFSSNFALYGDLSSRIMRILNQYTCDLQQYSIDEAFLDLSHINTAEEARTYCERIREQIMRGIGIPVSFGIAYTKTLCKVASHYAKHYTGYNGVCCITTETQRLKALSAYPIDEVWGIGRRSTAKLRTMGFNTALDFAQANPVIAKNLLHQPGMNTWKELNGEDCVSIREMPRKQSITRSRTFAHAVLDKTILEQALTDFCSACAKKLREQHSVCSQVIVFANTSRFNPLENSIYDSITLQEPTSDTRLLTQIILRSVRQQWQQNIPYKRAGVVLTNIESDHGVQQKLFDERDRIKERKLQMAIDKMNRQYGKNTVALALQIDNGEMSRLLDVGQRSPAYTTKLNEIITLHC